MKWSYGVTTCPQRRKELLPRTLASLKAGGFGEPRLFVDGCSETDSWRREFGLDVTCRYPVLRTYGNWLLALWELWIREPTAERFAIFQDDLVTSLNLRRYLESCPMPDKGYWNLFTAPSNQVKAPPNGRWYETGILNRDARFQTGKGALGLVFNRQGVMQLLRYSDPPNGNPEESSKAALVERPLDSSFGTKKVDGAIVTAMNRAGWREYCHDPSLVQHTGVVSSMMNPPHKPSLSFRGEGFDLMELVRDRTVNT